MYNWTKSKKSQLQLAYNFNYIQPTHKKAIEELWKTTRTLDDEMQKH